jgi:hypothetical protein
LGTGESSGEKIINVFGNEMRIAAVGFKYHASKHGGHGEVSSINDCVSLGILHCVWDIFNAIISQNILKFLGGEFRTIVVDAMSRSTRITT